MFAGRKANDKCGIELIVKYDRETVMFDVFHRNPDNLP
jgi:hypothetical protein